MVYVRFSYINICSLFHWDRFLWKQYPKDRNVTSVSSHANILMREEEETIVPNMCLLNIMGGEINENTTYS